MAIQFINLIFQRNEGCGLVYLNYMVEDQDEIGVKSDLLFSDQDDNNIIVFLIELLRNNANIINDFKFNIGMFSNFDMLVDPWQFVSDLEEILSEFNSDFGKQASIYLQTYQDLMEHIVDVEEVMKDFNANQRRDYCRTLIKDFKTVVYDSYFNNSELIPSGSYNHELLKELQINGISLSKVASFWNNIQFEYVQD